MGLSCKHNSFPFLCAGIFAVCFFLFNTTAFAQIQSGDSTLTDTIPATIKPGTGKGGNHNGNIPRDSIFTNVTSSQQLQTNKRDTVEDKNKKAKEPELKVEEDTLRPHSPKLAMGLSAVLPGLGQIYNRKYWKLPIVYAGLGVSAYFIWKETSSFRKYKETYKVRMGVDSSATDWFPAETDNTIKEMKEYHHRNVEISYIAAGVIYLLNIVDATVDAHLYDFDISDDLSMRVEPLMINYRDTSGKHYTAGVGLTMRF